MAFYCIHCRSETDPKYKACPYCGEAITDFLRRYVETPVDGKYQLLARLGVGGMGEVYKVLHVHLNAIRVIKLMRPAIAGDRGAKDRFLREARLATKINHPNVASLFDFSTLDDGSWYMVWEYIEGTNLHDLLEERGPLSPRYAAKLVIQALAGLEAIHRAGIVHRDISPENMMITRDADGEEHVKIIDLGIAKQWSEDAEDKTKTGMFVGKWKYCSPEHLGMLKAGERIDARADIYSFGIVLYEMLTGAAPFQAETPHGYLMLHASEAPRPLRDVNPGATAAPELEALIFRALEKDRSKRFANARDFAQALQAALPALSDSPGAPPPAQPAAGPTEDPTRVIARIDPNSPTVVTAAEHELAPTVRMTEIVPPGKRSRAPLFAAAAIVVVIAAGAVAMRNRAHTDRTPSPAPQRAQANVLVTVPRGRIAINAWPWANVTSIRNVTTGAPVEIDSPFVTPAPVDLSPGRYEITLSNPQYKQPITQIVDVAAGQDTLVNVQFSDAANAPLPGFQ
ncbi:MAG: protein kinase domain-containing protein [Thermoanaerobaculia bacterium]